MDGRRKNPDVNHAKFTPQQNLDQCNNIVGSFYLYIWPPLVP